MGSNESSWWAQDEIDAIGGRRFSEGTSADREIQRTLMELLNQLDGFDVLGKVKMIMATNRQGPGPSRGQQAPVRCRDPAPVALFQAGCAGPCSHATRATGPENRNPATQRGCARRDFEGPYAIISGPSLDLPETHNSLACWQIHAAPLAKHGDVDYEAIVKLAEGFNGADMRNICTEAGMFAIREERDYTVQEDFMKVCPSARGTCDDALADSDVSGPGRAR